MTKPLDLSSLRVPLRTVVACTIALAVAITATSVCADQAASTGAGDATAELTTWYRNVGQDGHYWKLPFQSSAKWITSGPMITALRQGTPSIITTSTSAVPWVIGTAFDPLVTITEHTTGKRIMVHIPLDTVLSDPPVNGWRGIGGADVTKPYLVWFVGSATMNTAGVQASGTKIAGSPLQIYDGTGPIMEDQTTSEPSHNDAMGNFREDELQAALADRNYYVPHTMEWLADPSQLANAGPIWPLHDIDTQGLSGPIPQGYTIGIPASTVIPAGQSRGFNLLFKTLQVYGALYYNVSYTGATQLSAYPTSAATKALVADMSASLPSVMRYVCILAADGTPGSQTSVQTAKGMIGGVRSDAFPAPPSLDYSPTHGVAVLPSTFGAWYPSGYNIPSKRNDR